MPNSLEVLRGQLANASSPKIKRVILGQIKRAKQRDEDEALRTQIRKCRRCGLNRTRSNAVPYSGPTRGRADLMLVGEAPGAKEDSLGIPFVGQSGKLLDNALHQAGTERDNCYVFNNLACRPPENRDPRPNELKACRTNFEAQLELGDCGVGVTLGAYALANVVGEPRKKIKMMEWMGKPVWVDGRIWVPAYHPAYILRNRDAWWTLIDTLRFALDLRFAEDLPLPTPIWEQVEMEGTKSADIAKPLKKKGYVVIFSRTLGTQIVLLQYEGKKPPATYAHLPQYTIDELIRVGVMGKGRQSGWTRKALRTLNMVKYELEGTVVNG